MNGWVAFDGHEGECAGQDGASASAAGGCWSELGGDYEDAVVGGIEAHVAGAYGRREGLGDVILIGTVLMDDGEGSVGV